MSDSRESAQWVACPICGESDMSKIPEGEEYLISCTNTACASNGGGNADALPELKSTHRLWEKDHDALKLAESQIAELTRQREELKADLLSYTAKAKCGHLWQFVYSDDRILGQTCAMCEAVSLRAELEQAREALRLADKELNRVPAQGYDGWRNAAKAVREALSRKENNHGQS